jgi:hypothetical protein
VTPTAEQQAIVEAYSQAKNLVIEAGAGTGKTSTLRMTAAARPERRATYIAYNRAIADDARRSFPPNVQCATAHSLAFRAVGRQFRHRLNGPRMPARVTAQLLRVDPLRVSDDVVLTAQQVARLVTDTVARFCYSADPDPHGGHVPALPGANSPAARAALRQAVVPLARKAWADLSHPDGQLKFTHDCQPPGTLVRRVVRGGSPLGSSAHEDVPIEQIREGDRVVSMTMTQRRGYIRRQGRPVTAVGYRDYQGELITVTTGRGRQSSYTAEHRCVVRLDCDLADGNHIVYLARCGSNYRIGRTTWRTRSQGNALGLRRRAETQHADAMWVLSVHATDAEAALEEALTAHRWRLPTWQFRSASETMSLAQFWAKVGNNVVEARACLSAHGLDLRYPFWQRGDGWANTRRPVILRARNLLSGMLVLEPDEIEPGPKGELRAHDGANGWTPATVTGSHYEGPVYNLDVAEDHTYIADGIATHNCYLKLWQLSGPVLDTDTVFLDEAQDANPLIADIVERQTHAQRVLVGDRCQAIYGWRGAIDAMRDFHADARLALSQSFRFGEPIATEANKWLQILRAPLRLRGADQIHSVVGPLGAVEAVLCRTNAEAVAQLMSAAGNGLRVALVGGGADIRRLAEAAIDLQAGRPTSHPELMAFTSWGMVQEYVEQEETGSDLKVFVQLIDRHGPEVIIDTIDRLVDERHASLVVSTAHKAKGREWPRVRIAQDFREPKGDNAQIAPADAMLAYVAVTRARHGLDRDGLEWVDAWQDGRPSTRQQEWSW